MCCMYTIKYYKYLYIYIYVCQEMALWHVFSRCSTITEAWFEAVLTINKWWVNMKHQTKKNMHLDMPKTWFKHHFWLIAKSLAPGDAFAMPQVLGGTRKAWGSINLHHSMTITLNWIEYDRILDFPIYSKIFWCSQLDPSIWVFLDISRHFLLQDEWMTEQLSSRQLLDTKTHFGPRTADWGPYDLSESNRGFTLCSR